MTTPVDIKDVIYVPKLSANLLSVSTLVKRGLAVVFTDKGGAIYKKDKLKLTGVPMLTATQENGMYKLYHDDEKAFEVITKNEQGLWHRRLGHLGLSNIKLLRDGIVTCIKFQEQGILCCESCSMGGKTKQPFNKKGGTRAKEVLELVHSDVCGQMSEKSISGYRYFLTFIDDKTRKTFVYFLKSKDEVVCKFKEFTALVERKTGKKLKILRSENGKEYVCAEMKKFMREKYKTSTDSAIHTRTKWDCRTMQPYSMYKSEKYVGGCKTRKEILGRSREHSSTFEKCFSDESCQRNDTWRSMERK